MSAINVGPCVTGVCLCNTLVCGVVNGKVTKTGLGNCDHCSALFIGVRGIEWDKMRSQRKVEKGEGNDRMKDMGKGIFKGLRKGQTR